MMNGITTVLVFKSITEGQYNLCHPSDPSMFIVCDEFGKASDVKSCQPGESFDMNVPPTSVQDCRLAPRTAPCDYPLLAMTTKGYYCLQVLSLL